MLSIMYQTRSSYGLIAAANLDFTLAGDLECFWPNWPEGGNTPPFHYVLHAPEARWLRRFEAYTPNSTKDKAVWKNFEHYKCSVPDQLLMPVWSLGTDAAVPYFPNTCESFNLLRSSTDIRRFWYPGYGSVGDMDVRPSLDLFYDPQIGPDEGEFIPPPGNLGALEQRALEYLMPSVQANLSLVNSLIELKDLHSLPRSADKLVDLAKSLWNGSGQVLRRILHAGADVYLQGQFNLKPLLSDIVGVFVTLSVVEKRIRSLLNAAGKLHTSHYSVRFTEGQDSTNHHDYELRGDAWDVVIENCRAEWSAKNAPSVFTVTMQYSFDYPVWRAEHARLLGILDALGVNLNPSILWNAIPWTFVIDWLVGVSRFLQQFTIHAFEPVLNVRHYCWSIKRSRIVYPTLRVGPMTEGLPYATVSLPASVETAYRRHITWPAYSWITSNQGTLRKATLGAALAITRRPRRKKNVGRRTFVGDDRLHRPVNKR
jgi:hypothetical protein